MAALRADGAHTSEPLDVAGHGQVTP
jgi:hypothetical protein